VQSSSSIQAEPAPAVAVCGATDIGLVRSQNEDTFMIADLASGQLSSPCIGTNFSVSSSGVLLLVCDGMGGHAAGEIASRVAAQAIKKSLVSEGPTVTEHPVESLKHAVLDANQAVLDEADTKPEERGMGTTCTAAIVLPGRLVIGQVGDSRAYLFRDGRLHALTRDQSLVSQLIDAGLLNAEEARRSPHRNILSQALGGHTRLEPVVTEVDVRAHDRLLVCSDGLHGPVSDARIAEIVATTPDLTAAAKALIAEALRAGGPDNVTVVVADCGGV
jgi:serine/threonine protein phosphatase PrpC